MTRKLPPLNALRSFEAAARLGSFKEAAGELNVSQSAVSHQIKLLEEVLGVDLFLRRPRSVELTAAGKSYHPTISQAFDHVAEGTRMLLRSQGDDVLTVQTYSTFAVRWLVPRLETFHRENPTLQVRLITSQWDVDFAQQDVDLAVMIGNSNRENLHYDYLFSPKLFPVCSPALLTGGDKLSAPRDLANHTILQVYPSENDWSLWLERAGVQDVNPNSGLSFDSYDHALKTALRGIGVALAMHPYVSEDFAAGLLINPFPDHEYAAPGDWYLVYPETRLRQRKIKKFRDWLRREIESDPDLRQLRSQAIN
ncbi:MAG: transcriptional regulator GcvA [Pseudomonadota bacterium]